MSIIVLGLSGVGKTYVSKHICKEYDKLYVNLGDLIEKLVQKGYLLNGKQEACLWIGNHSNNDKLVIDAHAILLRDGFVIQSIDQNDLMLMRTSLVILVEAPPHIVFQRRLIDQETRPDRFISSIKFLHRLQVKQRKYVKKVTRKTHLPLLILDNSNKNNWEDLIGTIF